MLCRYMAYSLFCQFCLTLFVYVYMYYVYYVCVIIKPASHHLRLLDVVPAVYDNHRPLYAHMCVCMCV